MPNFFKIGPLTIELVGFYWTIGIFGPVAAIWYWLIKLASGTSRFSFGVLAILLALAFTPTLVPGYGSETYDHITPAALVLLLCVLGFTSRWTMFAAALVPFVLATLTVFTALRRSKSPPSKDPQD
jgi:hypothetical protein